MDHLNPKEMGISHEDVRKLVKKSPITALLTRTALFFVIVAFCAQYVYHAVMGTIPADEFAWDWIGVSFTLLAIVEASAADYIKKVGFYETENGSIAYGFFLIGSLFTIVFAHSDLWPLAAVVMALFTIVAAGNVIRRGFDFFDLGP